MLGKSTAKPVLFGSSRFVFGLVGIRNPNKAANPAAPVARNHAAEPVEPAIAAGVETDRFGETQPPAWPNEFRSIPATVIGLDQQNIAFGRTPVPDRAVGERDVSLFGFGVTGIGMTVVGRNGCGESSDSQGSDDVSHDIRGSDACLNGG